MAWSNVAHLAAASPDQNTFTSGSIDTTGANLIVFCLDSVDVGTAATVSDSKSNTWTALTLSSGSIFRGRIYYCYAPTVGSGHTFTCTGASTLGSMYVSAWSGSASSPFDQQSTHYQGTNTTNSAGSITPTTDGQLIVALIGTNNTLNDAPTVGSGFTILDHSEETGSSSVTGAMAYLIQSTAAAINPAWTYALNDSNACIASFKVGASTGKTSHGFII